MVPNVHAHRLRYLGDEFEVLRVDMSGNDRHGSSGRSIDEDPIVRCKMSELPPMQMSF